ncbi:hypothetical protein HJG60_008929 [Phyllostomus discolor]|uniref:Uncharacterized protein n=1 Tax=Phyllostomus discolor TaxID=89673 RepID=A0A833YWP5_9CHIR|nr:hypothetical protein HJG60_008929 [Phyllostomus discolor]
MAQILFSQAYGSQRWSHPQVHPTPHLPGTTFACSRVHTPHTPPHLPNSKIHSHPHPACYTHPDLHPHSPHSLTPPLLLAGAGSLPVSLDIGICASTTCPTTAVGLTQPGSLLPGWGAGSGAAGGLAGTPALSDRSHAGPCPSKGSEWPPPMTIRPLFLLHHL